MKEHENRKLIGRAERVSFPEIMRGRVPARVDTGAKTSSIWTSDVSVKDGVLTAVFFGKGSPFFTGVPTSFSEFDSTVVSTSTGEVQKRHRVRLLVKVKGKKVRAWFTLADRSTQVYPVLIGRNVLRGKFIVDVKKGKTLKEAERKRTQALRSTLGKGRDKS